MSDRPEVLTRPLTRQKLAAVLGEKPEQIRAFEAMLDDVSRVLPDAAASTNARTTGLELVVGAYSGITLQQAIDKVHAAGGGIVKPLPIVHTLTQQLRLKSRVILDLSAGATLRRGFNTSPTGAGLIGIETGTDMAIRGGTLDGNGAAFSQSFNLVGGSGVRGLTLEGVTFLSVVDFHAVDLNDCEDVRITGCNFYGFWNKSGSRQFSEAIQLDNQGGTQNRNVQVRGCKFGGPLDAALVDFDPWPCALGNHAGIAGVYQDDIGFTDCSVSGASWAGLNLLNMRDVTVSDNRFTDCLHWVRLRLLDTVAPVQGCEGVTITGNTGRNTSGAAVKFAAPTLANAANAAAGRHKAVTITGNTSDGGGVHFADITFASRVTVGGNTAKGSTYGLAIRFSDHVTVAPNEFSGLDQTAMWINETVETVLAGLGYTSDITITGGNYSDLGYRGVHVNCAAKRVAINGPTITDPSTADPSREGIRVDSAADAVQIIGAVVRFTATVHSPFGISVSGSPTDVTIKACVSAGSTHPYQVQTVDALLDIEGTGSPEGVFSAAIGSRFMRTDGSAGTVLYLKESGIGDTGWATLSGGAGASWTEAEIDFGAAPVYSATFTVTDAGISPASKVQVLPCGKAATGRTADDWAWDGAMFAASPGTGSATCYAVFSPGPIVGKRRIQYSVGA